MGKVDSTDSSHDVVHVHFKTVLTHVALEPEIFTLVIALVAVDSVPPRQSSSLKEFGVWQAYQSTIAHTEMFDGLQRKRADVSVFETTNCLIIFVR